MKTCYQCKQEKPRSDFHKAAKSKDGLGHYCKACVSLNDARRYVDNPEYEKARHALWAKQNPEKNRASRKRWGEKNPEREAAIRSRSQLKKYGLTPNGYSRLLETQKGVCKICGKTCLRFKRLSVDHNHSTGEVRGLLCSKCNTALGLFDDSPERFRAAAEYLEGAV